MEVIKTNTEINNILSQEKGKKKIGFVPTMGALHQGHISLVKKASMENDIVVVSIFVNPTQFNDQSDLKKYPRNLDKDLEKLVSSGCNYIYTPEVKDIYPEPDTRQFDFKNLGEVMEGKHRPGHFNGVAQVVSRFFEIVDPDNAYFGLKDFQQLAIIKNLVKQLDLKVNIVPCPIVRELDGLAMSSRNIRLSSQQRENAPLIYKTLLEAKNLIQQKSVEEIRNWVELTINKNPFLDVEYFEIVDDETLKPITNWNDPVKYVGCIAVFCGSVRLIDNIYFN